MARYPVHLEIAADEGRWRSDKSVDLHSQACKGTDHPGHPEALFEHSDPAVDTVGLGWNVREFGDRSQL